MSEPILLAEPDEMMQALARVTDNNHVVEGLHVRIRDQFAGQTKTPLGVVMGLTLAIHDYIDGMPPQMRNVMLLEMPDYISAILPEGPAREEALAHFEAILSRS